MQKLLFKLSFLFLPVFVLIIYTNYFIDPGGNYHNKGFYKKVSKFIQEGKNIRIDEKFHNFLGSELILNLIKNQKEASKLAVIGSSRIIPVNSAMTGAKSFMNYGINGARFGDILGVYQVLYEEGLLPERLIVELNPLILMDKPLPQKGSFNEAYMRFLRRKFPTDGNKTVETKKENKLLKKIEAEFEYYSELLSPRYFQQGIKFLSSGEKKEKQSNIDFEFVEQSASNKEGILAFDNSRFKKINTEKSKQQKIFDARSSIKKIIFSTTSNPDPSTLILLETLFQDMIANNIEVVFLVLPFDPYFYDEEMKTFANNNVLVKTDLQLQELRKKLGNKFKVLGSTNPYHWNIKHKDAPTYYFDYAHMTSYGLAQFFGKLKKTNK